MRAQILGSAGLRLLVACRCGARAYLSAPRFKRRGYTVCDKCEAVIVYGSLEILAPAGAEEFMAGIRKQEEEREALTEEVVLAVRRFVQVYDSQPAWLWSPATQRLVQAVRPKLELLGGPIEPGRVAPRDGAEPETAYKSRESGQQLDDEMLDEGHEDDEQFDDASDDRG